MRNVRSANNQHRKSKQQLWSIHPMRLAYWDLVFDLADRIYVLLLLSLLQGGYQPLTQPVVRELATEVIFLLLKQKVLDPSEPRSLVIKDVDGFVKKFAEAKILAQRVRKAS